MPQKYATIPTSDDEQGQGSMPEAPPGYGQAAAGGETYENEDDYRKFGENVADCSIGLRHAFIRKVYTILFGQLMLTSVVSAVFMFATPVRNWIQSNTWMIWVSLIGSLVFLGLSFWKSRQYPLNIAFVTCFTLFEAYTVGVITSFYEQKIVLEALLITAVIFAGLTLFSFQTKYDFTGFAPYLFGGLWLLIGFGFVAMFFPASSGMELAYSIIATIIFSGYIIVDTQMIIKHYHYEEEVAASISLYLDIINLFLNILRILNSQSDN